MTEQKGSHYAFYPSDWLAGTRGLTAAETGVYITLVAMMYEREAPLDMERARLARLCGMPASGFNRALGVLIGEGKIVETDRGLWNTRVPKEIDRTHQKINAGKAGAEARWKRHERDNANAERQSQNLNMFDHTVEKTNEINETEMRSHSGRNATQNQNQNKSNTAAALNGEDCSAQAREQPQQRRVEIPDEDPFRSEPPAPPPGQLTGDDLLTEVMAAAGLTSGRIPTYWMPPTSTIHILKWRNDLGLSDTEILDTVRSSRANHDEAPSGPKAFDRAMSGLAGAKSHKLQPSSPSGRKPADGGKAARLDFYNRVANQKG